MRKELARGKDALATWVRDRVPDEFFASVADEQVREAYSCVIKWAEDHTQYSRAAKQAFAAAADPWLVAFAHANHCDLVTYEVSQPTSKARIKVPDAAGSFHVECLPPYVMLRQLRVRFLLDGAGTK